MNNIEIQEYTETNREKRMYKAKGGKFWCECDREKVGRWGKCPCGKMQNKKIKKR